MLLGVDGQRAARGHGVAGVDREVHQHLLQLARIGQDRPQVTGQRGDQLDVLANGPAQHFLHRGDDGVEVEDLRPDHVAPGEDEQLVGKPGRPFGGLLDLREVSAGRLQVPGRVRPGRGGDFLGDEGHVVEDHGEQVVEVVRDARRRAGRGSPDAGPAPAVVPSAPGTPGHRGARHRPSSRTAPATPGHRGARCRSLPQPSPRCPAAGRPRTTPRPPAGRAHVHPPSAGPCESPPDWPEGACRAGAAGQHATGPSGQGGLFPRAPRAGRTYATQPSRTEDRHRHRHRHRARSSLKVKNIKL